MHKDFPRYGHITGFDSRATPWVGCAIGVSAGRPKGTPENHSTTLPIEIRFGVVI